jgi:hypothetical protein
MCPLPITTNRSTQAFRGPPPRLTRCPLLIGGDFGTSCTTSSNACRGPVQNRLHAHPETRSSMCNFVRKTNQNFALGWGESSSHTSSGFLADRRRTLTQSQAAGAAATITGHPMPHEDEAMPYSQSSFCTSSISEIWPDCVRPVTLRQWLRLRLCVTVPSSTHCSHIY